VSKILKFTATTALGGLLVGINIVAEVVNWKKTNQQLKTLEEWSSSLSLGTEEKVSKAELNKLVKTLIGVCETKPKEISSEETEALNKVIEQFRDAQVKMHKNILTSQRNKSEGIIFGMVAATSIVVTLFASIKILSIGAVVGAMFPGFLATVGAIGIAGLVYFYVKKPNLFKAYLTDGVKLGCQKLWLTVQNYRLQSKRSDILLISKKIQNLCQAGVSPLKILGKVGKMEKMLTKLGGMQEAVAAGKGRVDKFKDRFSKAGVEDINRSLGISNKDTLGEKDLSKVLAFCLLRDYKQGPDSETQKLLKEMGFPNLKELRPEDLPKLIDKIFGSEVGETLQRIQEIPIPMKV